MRRAPRASSPARRADRDTEFGVVVSPSSRDHPLDGVVDDRQPQPRPEPGSGRRPGWTGWFGWWWCGVVPDHVTDRCGDAHPTPPWAWLATRCACLSAGRCRSGTWSGRTDPRSRRPHPRSHTRHALPRSCTPPNHPNRPITRAPARVVAQQLEERALIGRSASQPRAQPVQRRGALARTLTHQSRSTFGALTFLQKKGRATPARIIPWLETPS